MENEVTLLLGPLTLFLLHTFALPLPTHLTFFLPPS